MTRQVLNARIRMRRIQETQRETKRTSREALRRTQEKSPSCTPSDGHWRQRRGHPSSLPRRKPARSPSRPFWSTHTRGKRHDFLWRIHKQVPGNEELVIFNRSHYEGDSSKESTIVRAAYFAQRHILPSVKCACFGKASCSNILSLH